MVTKILIWSSIIVSILTFQLWEIIDERYCVKIYNIGYSLSTFLMALTIFIKTGKEIRYLTVFLLLITGNDLLDDLSLSSHIFNISEKIFTIVSVYVCYKIYKSNVRKIK